MAVKKKRTPKRASGTAKSPKRARPPAPKLRVALAVSLDGYIADKRGGVAWLDPYFSPEMDFTGFMNSIGASVMGRKTFDVAMKLGMPPSESEQRSVVLSSKRPRTAPAGFEHYRGDLKYLVDSLKRDLAGTGKDIWLMGGGEVIEAFRQLGLIDRWELSVIPVLVGDGIPLFPRHKRGPEGLKLVHHRAFSNGVVELWYEDAQPLKARPAKS